MLVLLIMGATFLGLRGTNFLASVSHIDNKDHQPSEFLPGDFYVRETPLLVFEDVFMDVE